MQMQFQGPPLPRFHLLGGGNGRSQGKQPALTCASQFSAWCPEEWRPFEGRPAAKAPACGTSKHRGLTLQTSSYPTGACSQRKCWSAAAAVSPATRSSDRLKRNGLQGPNAFAGPAAKQQSGATPTNNLGATGGANTLCAYGWGGQTLSWQPTRMKYLRAPVLQKANCQLLLTF